MEQEEKSHALQIKAIRGITGMIRYKCTIYQGGRFGFGPLML